MLLPHGTVIALIDGKHLELYRNVGDEAAPEFASLPSPKLDTHNHSGSSHHSSPGNHADKLVSEDAHANAAAQWLNSQALGNKIDHLVVIAPPRTLGELRRHYHKRLEDKLLAELHKDLIGKPPEQILATLREK